MGKYLAVCDSYGFQGKHWRKNDIAITSDREIPPLKHFKCLDAESADEVTTNTDSDLSELSVKELKVLADEKGIEYPPVIKKADLIALIEKGSGE